MSAVKRAPADLGPAGKALWSEVQGDLKAVGAELGPDGVAVLRAACETADLIRRLTAELEGAPLTMPGVRGATVANPLLAEVRQNRALQATLLARLKLAEAGEDAKVARTRSARRAAQVRWSGAGRAGIGGRGA